MDLSGFARVTDYWLLNVRLSFKIHKVKWPKIGLYNLMKIDKKYLDVRIIFISVTIIQ